MSARCIDRLPDELLDVDQRLLPFVGEAFARIVPVLRPLSRDDRILVACHVLALIYMPAAQEGER
jgi:hypothetical protein